MELIRGIHNIKPRHRGCVLTIGNFDGVHQGHHAVLARLQEKAAQLGLPACVMLFEPQPLELFAGDAAPARLSRWREKYEALKGMQIDRMLCVRFTHRFAEQAASTFIEQLLVATVLMGGVLGYLSPDLAQWGAWSMGKASLELTLLLCLGGALYGIVLLVLGVRPRHLKSGQQ